MPSKTPEAILVHLLDNIHLCRQFVAGMTYSEFLDDRRTIYAVTRCLEIISEASRRLPGKMKARYPEIPWVDIAGAGNIYRHDYESVRDDILWRTAHQGLSPLLMFVEFELDHLVTRDGRANTPEDGMAS